MRASGTRHGVGSHARHTSKGRHTTTYTARTTTPCSFVSCVRHPACAYALAPPCATCSLIRPSRVDRVLRSLRERCYRRLETALVCQVDNKMAPHGPQTAEHVGAPQGSFVLQSHLRLSNRRTFGGLTRCRSICSSDFHLSDQLVQYRAKLR